MNTTHLKNKIITLLRGNNLNVEAVKSLGFTTFINHYRYRYVNRDEMVLEPLYNLDKVDRECSISAKGGETTVELIDKETGIEARAVAVCALTDAYERSVGIRYGIHRALRDMLKQIRHKETATIAE